MNNLEKERQNLLVEVFALTGQKMAVDDPATVAAIFYSTLVRQATDELRQTGVDIQSELKAAIAEHASAEVQAEIQKQKGALARFGDEVRTTIRRAAAEVSSTDGIQVNPTTATIAIFLAAVLSALAVIKFAPSSILTATDRNNIVYGQTLLKVYSKLDDKAKAKIEAALKEELK